MAGQFPACLLFVFLALLPGILAEDASPSDGAFGLSGKLREKRVAGQLTGEIKGLAARLGDRDFRVREDCTVKLIVIGKRSKSARNLVGSQMNTAKRNADPEVTERARRVLKAIYPPRTIPAHLDAITAPS